MKIRIKGNTLRLRLSQSDLSIFAEKGIYSESISFGPDEDNILTYSVISSDRSDIGAFFHNNLIEIYIPHNTANTWTSSEEVSVSHSVAISDNKTLDILVEKDFQCLHKRPGEDEKDNFPNPLAENKLN